jgi:pSer/pThr/pTyr-binding forkhead associated (FHA) protein
VSDDPRRHESRDTDTGPQGTRVFRRQDIRQHIEERGAGSTGLADPASSAVLIGANGAFRGRRIDIPGGRSTLGRDPTNNIIVNDDSVSLVHARLVEKSGEWRVLNLLSTNGTWINSKKVSDGILRDGDTVCFGQAEFRFHITGKPRPAGLWSRVRRWFGRGR